MQFQPVWLTLRLHSMRITCQAMGWMGVEKNERVIYANNGKKIENKLIKNIWEKRAWQKKPVPYSISQVRMNFTRYATCMLLLLFVYRPESTSLPNLTYKIKQNSKLVFRSQRSRASKIHAYDWLHQLTECFFHILSALS